MARTPHQEQYGIIPAYAGSTSCGDGHSPRPRDHPRIRGEHRRPACRARRQRGSSPHTRGARAARRRLGRLAGIIPAYAGSTEAPERLPAHSGDHPRIRGEHGKWGRGPGRGPGSSPHTRGALHAEHSTVRIIGIIPAYAGSTPLPHLGYLRRRDHPRIRGEHGRDIVHVGPPPGSSPHTRGALP